MVYSVLVVDDSSFFRRHLTEIINECPELRVIGEASNGREAVDKTNHLKPDVITMDFEMPMMNGVVAVKNIMAQQPTPILMLSSLTFDGARITLDALEAGAVDFLPKKFDEIAKHAEGIKKEIHQRILGIVRGAKHEAAGSTEASLPTAPDALAASPEGVNSLPASVPRPEKSKGAISNTLNALRKPSAANSPSDKASNVAAAAITVHTLKHVTKLDADLVLIGASTGGPVAIATILKSLPANFPKPVVIVQHMPATFTPEFAHRLDDQLPITVKHAEHNDVLEAGKVYIAPGGMQCMIARGQPVRLHIAKGDDRVSYHPSVDITFASAIGQYGKKVLAIACTGMGNDGCDGARLLKQAGATIWAQDEKSSLIYGMPASVTNAGYSDLNLTLNDIGPALLKAF